MATGAMLTCSFGMAPSTLTALPTPKVMVENKPAATIMDNKPFVNIAPFGLCSSLANPVTAAQTSAALGVLTPGACVPVIPAPWVPGSPTVLAGAMPVLSQASKCMCAYGGVISVGFPASVTTNVP